MGDDDPGGTGSTGVQELFWARQGWAKRRRNRSTPPLPLAGEGWGGGIAANDAVHSVERAPTRRAPCARRPPPQAGEARSPPLLIAQHDQRIGAVGDAAPLRIVVGLE